MNFRNIRGFEKKKPLENAWRGINLSVLTKDVSNYDKCMGENNNIYEESNIYYYDNIYYKLRQSTKFDSEF